MQPTSHYVTLTLPDHKTARGQVVYLQPTAERAISGTGEQRAVVHIVFSDWLAPSGYEAVYATSTQSITGRYILRGYSDAGGQWLFMGTFICTSSQPLPLAPVRVMIVEDHPLLLTSLQFLLNRIPVLSVVATACDGVEALPLIQETEPQVLILDLHLPRMNGSEVLDELRRMKSSVQVIVLSALPEDTVKQLVRDKDVAAYVSKADPSRLFDTLHRVIDNHRSA
jgi:CheY-like chemotaxis protein